MFDNKIKTRSVLFTAVIPPIADAIFAVIVISLIWFSIFWFSIFWVLIAIAAIVDAFFAIYSIIQWYYLTKSVSVICDGDGEQPQKNYLLVVLLGWVTFGIYPLYYYYKLQNRISKNGHRYGVSIQEDGSSFLMWYLIGFLTFGITTIVALILLVESYNKLVEGYLADENKGKAFDLPMPKPAGESHSYIVCIEGAENEPMLGTAIPIKENESIIVGRKAEEAHLVLMDGTISRKHCIIRKAPGVGVLVKDVSKNGTFWENGQRLPYGTYTPVPSGSIIQLSHKTKLRITDA